MTGTELGHLADQLADVIKKIGEIPDALTASKTRSLRAKLEQAAADLVNRLGQLDPVRMPSSFFDPADPRLFGIFAALALIGQERRPLDSVGDHQFYGSGVYAIYYTGNAELYRPIRNTETPIYVGKADPKSRGAKTPKQQGAQLSGRLGEHRRNILKASETLDIADFECRFLVIASGWQTAAESALIHLFLPIWNKEVKILLGFGKHGDSAKTRKNKRSPWDVLHEGRKWAGNKRIKDQKSLEQIEEEVAAHFAKHPPITDSEHVLKELFSQVKLST